MAAAAPSVLQSSPTITDILWQFAQRNIWPGSQKQADALMKQFKSKTLAQFQTYMAQHYKPSARPLAHTPTWVMNELRPEVGNKVSFFGADPSIAKILLQSASEGWTPDKVQSHLEANPWWSSHNQTQKQWLISGPADQQVIRAATAQKLSDQWYSLYGERVDPNTFLKNSDNVASGAISLDQWVAEQRGSAAYKARYPGMAARQAAGLPAIDETQYRTLEEQYRQQLAQHGMSGQYFDQPQDFTQLFTRDIDPTELAKRLDAYKAISSVYSPYMKQAFETHAGISNLSNADLYGVVSGQRPDLVGAYTKATGTSPPMVSLYDLGQSQQQALSQEQAQFSSGGGVKGATPGQDIKTTTDIAQAI